MGVVQRFYKHDITDNWYTHVWLILKYQFLMHMLHIYNIMKMLMLLVITIILVISSPVVI